MKKILFVALCSCLICSCKGQTTVTSIDQKGGITANGIINGNQSSSKKNLDSLTEVYMDNEIHLIRKQKDSIYNLLRLERIRLDMLVKYNRIIIKNPSQIKYLKNWLARALQ